MPATIQFSVNGKDATVSSEPDRPLLDVLREDLHLMGAKYGCGEGRCGACSVLIDGKRVFSCLTAVQDAANKKVLTIEGLANGEQLHTVQEAFLAEASLQCGYCTAGMIMAAVSLLNERPNPTDAEIMSGMNRNLCRCCTYPRITSAVKRAAAAGRQ